MALYSFSDNPLEEIEATSFNEIGKFDTSWEILLGAVETPQKIINRKGRNQ